MSNYIVIIISVIGVIVGSAMALHIGSVTHIDTFWPLVVGLVAGSGIGFAFLLNYKSPDAVASKHEQQGEQAAQSGR